jgi:hypothetical protein
MDIKVNVGSLKKGMYVSNLDRPWIDTPFMLEGMLIKSDEEINTLLKYCTYVYVDTNKSINIILDKPDQPRLKSNPDLEHYLEDTSSKQVDYRNTTTTEEELPDTRVALDNASDQVADIMDDVKDGRTLDIKAVRSVVEPILDSIIRNADAYMWLMMMQKKSNYIYSHSINNCGLRSHSGGTWGCQKKS